MHWSARAAALSTSPARARSMHSSFHRVKWLPCSPVGGASSPKRRRIAWVRVRARARVRVRDRGRGRG